MSRLKPGPISKATTTTKATTTAKATTATKTTVDPPPSAQDDNKKTQWHKQERERVYIPHLRIEMWGTHSFVIGLGEQATTNATAGPPLREGSQFHWERVTGRDGPHDKRSLRLR